MRKLFPYLLLGIFFILLMGELHNCIIFFLAEADHGAPCLPYAEGGGRKLSPCVLQKYSVCGERQPQGDPASGEWRNHRELRQAGRAGTAASRQIIFPVPSELYYQPFYFVEKMDTGKFIVQSAEIPVSRKYQRAAREMYYDYMFEKM